MLFKESMLSSLSFYLRGDLTPAGQLTATAPAAVTEDSPSLLQGIGSSGWAFPPVRVQRGFLCVFEVIKTGEV